MFGVLINKLPLTFRDKYRDAWNDAKLEILIALGRFVRLFHKPTKPINADGSINIHLGCGSIEHPAFINIDILPAKHIHYVSRIDKLYQFQNDSVDLLYACHCLEHFSHRQLLRVLKEWHRVLKKGGILRVSVPDFNSMVDLYLAAGRDIQCVLGPLTGGQEHKYNYHMTIFNETYLKKLFLDAGYMKVQKWIPGSSDLKTFDDWSAKFITYKNRTYPISLNLEAFK